MEFVQLPTDPKTANCKGYGFVQVSLIFSNISILRTVCLFTLLFYLLRKTAFGKKQRLSDMILHEITVVLNLDSKITFATSG